jgi:hypothetical protein
VNRTEKICQECIAGHRLCVITMQTRYMLMQHMGPPRELARAVMWFALRA